MLSKFSLLTATVLAAGGDYDYNDDNGADWPDLDIADNNCGGPTQSPIDLPAQGTKGWRQNVQKKYKWNKDDEFTKSYDNAFNVNPAWVGDTTKTNLDVDSEDYAWGFTSKLAETVFGADTTFEAQQFHFHAGSEHTIDGVRHDFEMHTVHYPTETKEDFLAAAMGIIFSVEDYTAKLTWAEERIIDTFFDSLQLDDETEDGPTVDMVTYGNLMEMVDMNNRYIYKGSVTTPPCLGNVYWNVLMTIYPIKAEHLALFEAQLDRVTDLKSNGNWRKIQEFSEDHTLSVVRQEKNKGFFAGPLSLVTRMFEWMLSVVQKNK